MTQEYLKTFACQIFSLGATSNQIRLQNTVTLAFSLFIGTRMNVLRYSLFIDFINQFQNISTVSIHSNRSNDQQFMLNTIFPTVLLFQELPCLRCILVSLAP